MRTYCLNTHRRLSALKMSSFCRDPDELVGRSIWDEFPALVGTRFAVEAKSALDGNRLVECDEFFEPLGKWFENRIVPSPTGITIFSRDISERYESARALAPSEEQFQVLANLIPTLAWMADSSGWIFWYNDRWYEYTGTTPQQMEGWASPSAAISWRQWVAR